MEAGERVRPRLRGEPHADWPRGRVGAGPAANRASIGWAARERRRKAGGPREAEPRGGEFLLGPCGLVGAGRGRGAGRPRVNAESGL